MTRIDEHKVFPTVPSVGTGRDLPSKSIRARLVALALFILFPFSSTFAGSDKIAKDLQNGDRNSTVDVIIQFNQVPTEAHHQKVQDKGGVLKTRLDFIKGAHYSVPVESLDALADDPDVAYISPDR